MGRVSETEGRQGKQGGVLQTFKNYLERNRLGELMVMNGHLSAGQLRYALSCQRSNQRNLGRILIDEQLVSRAALYSVLAQQTAIRLMVGFTTLMIAFSCMGMKTAKAGSIRDIPAQVRLASAANAAFAPVASYPALFSAGERRSGNLDPFTKWTSMFGRFERSAAQPSGQKIIDNWKRNLQAYQGQPLRQMAENVNTLVNKTDYIEDTNNYGQSDYWATPVEFFTRGGDCEDYAIAKYASLRALGVPEDRMRVAIVQDLQKNIPHAILIVYTDEGPLVLDNQNKRALSADSIRHYKPIFSINRTAWWLHTKPSSTQLASAE